MWPRKLKLKLKILLTQQQKKLRTIPFQLKILFLRCLFMSTPYQLHKLGLLGNTTNLLLINNILAIMSVMNSSVMTCSTISWNKEDNGKPSYQDWKEIILLASNPKISENRFNLM